MARIIVIGGTGFAGSHIAAEAASRGHEVVSVSRSKPSEPIAGVQYVQGDVLDAASLADTFAGADVVVSAISPRGDMTDSGLDAVRALVQALTGTPTRLGVVGGAMGSLSAPGGPALWDLGVPEEYRHEAKFGMDSLDILQASPADLDWFYVHPPKEFGAWVAGERTGSYRDGGEVFVEDADGRSYISGADYAVAFVDEIENGKHRRERFTVGY